MKLGLILTNQPVVKQSGIIGEKLKELNVPIHECFNLRLKYYIYKNSTLPEGVDNYIHRNRDYILNLIIVETLLGEQSKEKTIDDIENIMEGLLNTSSFIYVTNIPKLTIIPPLYTPGNTSNSCISIKVSSSSTEIFNCFSITINVVKNLNDRP